jgi:hypothetical protein
MPSLGTFVMTGDNAHDFGAPNKRLADLVWRITARPPNAVTVDSNVPAQVTRVGYVAYGTSSNGTGVRSTWGVAEMRYVSFEHEDWSLLDDVRGDFQFVQWHLLPGWELTTEVFTY